jgi:lysozyme family protein
MIIYDIGFVSVIDELLEDEKGYANDPNDPGGETKYGISKRSYPDLDIKNLKKSQAVAIYFADWWTKYGYINIDDLELAGELLEASVNMGAKQAHKILQRTINGTFPAWELAIDGILGPKTLKAINLVHPGWFLAEFRLALIQFYLNLKKPRYLSSWVRRAIT